MLKNIVIVIVVLIAGVLIYAATRPDTFRVERSTTISAPADRIFELINDFHRWTAWSPWETIDPALKRTYGGNESGLGSTYEWLGNNQVGQGRMEISESTPPTKIVIKLDFIKPFEAHNIAEFTLVPNGNETKVNWAMHGPSPYVAKVMGVFVSMDRMVGKDFEKGLANLKAAAEK
jgi:carbon monoxide dehydrogenase subunit G